MLKLKANGHTSAQTAAVLGIGMHTVNGILGRIYRVLGVRNEAHAVAVAIAVGELGIHEIDIPAQQQEEAA